MALKNLNKAPFPSANYTANHIVDKVMTVCHSDCKAGKPCLLSDDGVCYSMLMIDQYDMHWLYVTERSSEHSSERNNKCNEEHNEKDRNY